MFLLLILSLVAGGQSFLFSRGQYQGFPEEPEYESYDYRPYYAPPAKNWGLFYPQPPTLGPVYERPEEYYNAPPLFTPVVVRMPSSQTVLLPFRAVYTFPPLIERLVERIQTVYSVYNPPEDLTRPAPSTTLSPPTTSTFVPPPSTSSYLPPTTTSKFLPSETTQTPPATTTSPPPATTLPSSTEELPETTNRVSTLAVYEVRPTTTDQPTEETTTVLPTTDETTTQDLTTEEATTDAENYISPETEQPLQYDIPMGRLLLYPEKVKRSLNK